MRTDEQLIKETEENIWETNYSGSSLICSVQPIGLNDDYMVL